MRPSTPLSNRYYDPATAQFLTIDPAVSQTQAPYTYTSDNPINATDPLGLWNISDLIPEVVAVGITAGRHVLNWLNQEQANFDEGLCNPLNQIPLILIGGLADGGDGGDDFAAEESGFTGSTTLHGAEQLQAAGFDNTDMALIKAGNSYEQEDGAIAYVSQTGPNSYNMIVENELGQIVTAHRGMTFKELSGLARNQGWTGWP